MILHVFGVNCNHDKYKVNMLTFTLVIEHPSFFLSFFLNLFTFRVK